MTFIIYDKITKEIVGTADRESRIDEEIKNVCQSEGYGGVPDDYAATPAPVLLPNQMWEIQRDTAVAVPAPPTERQLRQARRQELLDIPRSDWTTAQLREIIQLVAQEHI